MKTDWIRVLRDVLIVVVLGALGTLGFTVLLVGQPAWTQYILAFVMLTAGFTISGSLKGAGRVRHLALVALGVWLVNVVDSLREPERLPANLFQGLVVVIVSVLVGGAISFVVKRPAPSSAPPGD